MATRMPKGNWSEYSVYGNLSTKKDNKVKRKNRKKRGNRPKICSPASMYASSLKLSALCVS